MSDTALSLLHEAMHLRMHGEYAPGGKENWRDWDTRATAYLMGNPPDREAPGKPGVPGDGGKDCTISGPSGDSPGIEPLTPPSKISDICPNGVLVYDMVLPPPIKPGDLWKPFRNALAGSRGDEGSTS